MPSARLFSFRVRASSPSRRTSGAVDPEAARKKGGARLESVCKGSGSASLPGGLKTPLRAPCASSYIALARISFLCVPCVVRALARVPSTYAGPVRPVRLQGSRPFSRLLGNQEIGKGDFGLAGLAQGPVRPLGQSLPTGPDPSLSWRPRGRLASAGPLPGEGTGWGRAGSQFQTIIVDGFQTSESCRVLCPAAEKGQRHKDSQRSAVAL